MQIKTKKINVSSELITLINKILKIANTLLFMITWHIPHEVELNFCWACSIQTIVHDLTPKIKQYKTFDRSHSITFPFSLSLAISAFIASFLFLLANTLAVTPLTLGSIFSSGEGGGGRRAAAFALSAPMNITVATPIKLFVNVLNHNH